MSITIYMCTISTDIKSILLYLIVLLRVLYIRATINMSLTRIVLFISTQSKACYTCMQFLKTHDMPVHVVRLDTAESRTKAANGTFFQIKVVPSMVVNYSDGNMQLFIGNDKIIQFLKALGSSEEDVQPQTNMYGPGVRAPSKPTYAARPNGLNPTSNLNQGNEMIVEEIVENDDEINEHIDRDDEVTFTPSKIERNRKYIIDDDIEDNTKVKNKKKKSPPIIFTEDKDTEVEVEYLPEEHNDIKESRVDRNNVKGKSRMQDLINKAKVLEQNRLESLGYNESELPHYH